MQRLLYVSETCIEHSKAQVEVSNIAAHAQVKNLRLDITGALIFTGQHFAQVLEGPPEAVNMLMADIHNDIRHRNIAVVDKSFITRRRFPDWQMAYHGPYPFVARHVAKLFHATSQFERRRAVDWITDLALEFAVQ